LIGSVLVLAHSQEIVHPVHQNLIDEIKAKATTWIPHEVVTNPLSQRSAEAVLGLLGTNTVTYPPSNDPLQELVGDASFDSRV